MSDKMDKEIEFYKALRLVTSNKYVRAIIIIFLLILLDDVSRIFLGDGLISNVDQYIEGFVEG
jgi:hypothetical protein